jgi:hypothetical protein
MYLFPPPIISCSVDEVLRRSKILILSLSTYFELAYKVFRTIFLSLAANSSSFKS